ncbi:LCP family protein [Chloroflexota bacterium]
MNLTNVEFGDETVVPIFDAVPERVEFHPYQANYDFVNFLILGSDRLSSTESYRTDVIIVVAINRTTQTIRLLSIPRDLYVYIPGWGMDRINTAELHQTQLAAVSHPLGLLAETIEYNLGIRVDHLARIDFAGFEFLVDLVGGLPIPVDCVVTGYQFSTESNTWVPFSLEPGLYQMDGSSALWYVRQRIESSDFDRNRRQQIVLRALWDKIKTVDLISTSAIWGELASYLETDVTYDQILSFVPLILNLDVARIDSQFIGIEQVRQWQTPSDSSVLVFAPDALPQVVEKFLAPQNDRQFISEQAIVNVLNGSSVENADQLAAAQLRWLGISASALGNTPQHTAATSIFDHTGQVKGSSLSIIQQAFNVLPNQVNLTINESGPDFTVVIGESYESCLTKPWEPFQ